MEAIYFGNIKVWGFGSGNGPWIMADMENGLYSGSNAGLNSADPTTSYRFTTAMIEGGANQWAILGGNAQSGTLATDFSGVRPSGYNPMKKQGAIILGIGGDNSKGSAGTFYEGVMTTGYAYRLDRGRRPGQHRRGRLRRPVAAAAGRPGRSCPASAAPCCIDNNNGSGTDGNKVQVWACDGYAPRRTGPSTATARSPSTAAAWTSPAPSTPTGR